MKKPSNYLLALRCGLGLIFPQKLLYSVQSGLKLYDFSIVAASLHEVVLGSEAADGIWYNNNDSDNWESDHSTYFALHFMLFECINATSLCISLSVFVGFSFDKSFNIFVSEGHESFTCRIFGCFFWCTARGHRNLLVVISFLNKPSEQRSRTTKSWQAVVKSGAKEGA